MNDKASGPHSAPVSKWNDLKPRIASALVIAAFAAAALWAGGIWFMLFTAVACGAMIWELARMLAPQSGANALLLGGLSGAALIGAGLALRQGGDLVALLILAAPLVLGFWRVPARRGLFAGYGALILGASLGLIVLRAGFGPIWVLWLILVVIATDVAGYFAGKSLGGPKFWPRVSPKKTWAGTAAGWLAAGLVGAGFIALFGWGSFVIPASLALSLAAQMGDIAESAIKRSAGVKDSSALIPGHGGVLDRFDGILGAALMAALLLTVMQLG